MEKKVMKRKLLVIISVSLVLSILGNIALFVYGKKYEMGYSNCKNEISATYNYLNSITIRNFKNAIEEKRDMIVYVGRPDCSDCNYFEPTFREVINQYNLFEDIYYLNVKNYRESNTEETWQNFKRKYGFTQTPAILIYQDGNLKSMIEWDSEEGLSKERLVEWLTYNNIVH